MSGVIYDGPDGSKLYGDGREVNPVSRGGAEMDNSTGSINYNYQATEVVGETITEHHLREELRVANAHIKGLAAKLKELGDGQ